MDINTYFDNHVFYINLDRREDRRAECVAELGRHGIRAERFRAYDSLKFKKNSPMTMPEVGCSMSHADLLQQMISNGWQRMLVLEDDVQFVDDVQARFAEAIADVPDDWEMLYFGGNHEVVPEFMTERLCRGKRVYTTSSYAITLEAAKQVLPKIRQLIVQVDVAYAMHLHRNNRTYCFVPPLAWQRPSFSDIQNGFRDYTAFLRDRTQRAVVNSEAARHRTVNQRGTNVRRLDEKIPQRPGYAPHSTEGVVLQTFAANRIDYARLRDLCDIRVGRDVDVNVVIPVRGRVDNAKPVVEHLRRAMSGLPGKSFAITFVEYSLERSYEWPSQALDTDYVHMPFDGMFNKCLAMNAGFLYGARADHYLFHDVDLLVQSDFFAKLFDGIGRMARQAFARRRVLFCCSELSSRLMAGADASALTKDSEGVQEPTMDRWRAPGGSILVSREQFVATGGFDAELFYGYSIEDQMFYDKLEMTGGIESCDGIEVFHLHHETKSGSNPFLAEHQNLYACFSRDTADGRNRLINQERANLWGE